jgi:LacI family transcriptional regulator
MTLKDIAQRAGVSRGTVDRVIHQRPHVSKKAFHKIRQVLEDADYTPNLAARALSSQNTYFFGVIFAHNSGAFTADVILGVKDAEKAVKAFGFTVTVEAIIAYTAEKQLELLDEYEKRGAVGIAIVPILDERIAARLNELSAKGIPVITFNSDIERTRRLCFVGPDNYKEGRTAGALLEGLLQEDGEVLVITGSHALYCHEQRIKGFTHRLQEGKKRLHITGMYENFDGDEESYEILTKYVAASGMPDGVYLTGGGAWGLGRAVKYMLPRQPRIICHDVTPQITALLKEDIIDFTIGQDPHSQGFLPVHMLFDLAVKKETIKQEIFYTSIDIYTKENCMLRG